MGAVILEVARYNIIMLSMNSVKLVKELNLI